MGLTRKNRGLNGDLIIEPKDLRSSSSVTERQTVTANTLDDAITIQTKQNILVKPVEESDSATTTTLSIGLYNSTTSSTVYAYITGLAINNSSAVCLIESDGATVYYPSNPTSNGTALSANCSIPLGAPGTTTWCTIPQIAGGRIWFCVGSTLTFLLNPGDTGPGLVEPSVSNTSDPNYYLTWDFCEFTYNSTELFANISYVDFVCLPIALTLTNTSDTITHVSGMASDGLSTVCTNLIAQNAIDGAGWNQLVITNNGSNLRALSPLNGMVFNSSLFADYFTSYVNSVWAAYATSPLTVDTQASWGVVEGYTASGSLTFSGVGSFTQPSAGDIFSGSTGAFAPQESNTDELLAIGARLDAAFNRTTLLIDSVQPDDEVVSTYYTNPVTNHYARIVHAANLDGKGYCFPYDDVGPVGGVDQSGEVNDPSPSSLLVTVGGGNAYAKMRMRKRSGVEVEDTATSQSQMPMKHMQMRRSLHWNEKVEEKDREMMMSEEKERDLELGEHPKSLAEFDRDESRPRISVLPSLNRLFGEYFTKLQALPSTARLRPIFDILNSFLVSFLSLSFRAILSRVFLLFLVLILYLVGILDRGAPQDLRQGHVGEQMFFVNATLAGQGDGLDLWQQAS